MTLIHDFDLEILKMYLRTTDEVCRSMHSKVRARTAQNRHTDTHTDATERITMPHSWVVKCTALNRTLTLEAHNPVT